VKLCLVFDRKCKAADVIVAAVDIEKSKSGDAEKPLYVVDQLVIGLVCWLRLQTGLLTLDSRSGEPKFDNGPPGATGLRNRQSGRGR
jgi:hypothetical protein